MSITNFAPPPTDPAHELLRATNLAAASSVLDRFADTLEEMPVDPGSAEARRGAEAMRGFAVAAARGLATQLRWEVEAAAPPA
ncbi:hypothetical protein J0H58_03020 [bacterium]|nr:hypothetical protein [bacterium]